MSEPSANRSIKNAIVASAAVAATFAGFAAAPTLFSPEAAARQIAIAPPNGAPMSFADLVERVSPAVVSIQVRQRSEAVPAPRLPPGLEDFFPQPPERGPRETTALGSGFFIDSRGTVVTNHHVVAGATEIVVRTSDAKEFKAEIVGSDELTDLAVLRLTDARRSDFAFVVFDTDAELRVGDWVVAVGNPFGLEGTATAGIVSAIGRRNIGGSSLVDFIQTDAPINRGNSGGPTFDLRGRVVGVNSAIFSPTGGNVGIGFAIPADTADRVIRQLLTGKPVSRGWLGVSVQPMDDDLAKSFGLDENQGALVANVLPGGPAEAAGLRAGDVILQVNGQRVEDQTDLTRKVAGANAGSTARFDILRSGERQTISIKLGERPNEQQLASADGGAAPQGAAPSDARDAALGATVRPATADDRRRLRLTPDEPALVITGLDAASPLADKGFTPGLGLLTAGGQPLRTPQDLVTAVNAARQANRPLQLLVRGPEGPSRFVAVDLSGG